MWDSLKLMYFLYQLANESFSLVVQLQTVTISLYKVSKLIYVMWLVVGLERCESINHFDCFSINDRKWQLS